MLYIPTIGYSMYAIYTYSPMDPMGDIIWLKYSGVVCRS